MSPAPPPGFDVVTDSNYHYIPTAWVCLTMVALFGIATAIHFLAALYSRMWFLLPTAVLAGLGEVLGWYARYWSSRNFGIEDTPFTIQICATIIAPTPLLAAYFILMGRLIFALGPQYSRFTKKKYMVLFTTADVVALVIQAFEGAEASGSNTNPTTGANIMLGGIAFQLASLVLFILVSVEFVIRLHFDRPFMSKLASEPIPLSSSSSPNLDHVYRKGGFFGLPSKTRALLYGMAFSITCLFIRAVYRLVELSDGWNGHVISTQVLFNVLDGTMVFLAFGTLCVLHPGFLMERHRDWAK